MSDIESAAPSSTEPMQDVAPVQESIDPAAPHIPEAVTHGSLLTEFVAAIRRDARGISNHLESLLEKAAHHFGL